MKKIKIKFRKLVCASLFIIGYTIQVEAQTNEYFKTTWNTETGDPGNATIVLPIYDGSYDVDVNNDGDFDDTGDFTNLTGSKTIDFGTPGIYTIAVRPNPTNNTSKQLRISHGNSGDTPEKLMSIDKWGDIVWTSMSNAFQDCSNMILADDAGVPDLTMVTSMWNAFNGATNFNGNISTWNVSNVTSMTYMFNDATSFNRDLSNWDVSNVTSMWNTFNGATSFNGDLSTWDVSNVTNMWNTFEGATSFNGDLSTWNVSNVTDMDSMFEGATNFNGNISSWNVSNVGDMRGAFQGATNFNGDLSSWNVSNVRFMNSMFSGATSFSSENYDALLTEWAKLALQDDINFGAPPTTYCSGKAGREILINTYNWYITGDMGLSCPVAPFVTTWNTEIGDSGNATIVLPIVLPTYGASYDVDVNNDGDFDDTGDLTNLKGTITIDFVTPGIYTIAVRPNPTNNTSKQLRINHGLSGDTPEKLMSIDKWGDIVWTSMSNAFQDCSNMILADDAGVPDLTMVTSMWNAFNGATNFNGNISTWNVSAVTDMGWVFSNATSFNQDIGDWNVSAVTDMSWMFSSADDFNQDIGDWNVSAVTDMRLMFSSADDFNQDIGDWNVSAVTSMGLMFNGASSFTSENYDALLIGWSNLIPQRGISFGAPPTTYCLGEAGREILINTYNWYITGDNGLDCTAASTDEEFLSNTKIYPNPSNDKISIESSFEIDKLELYNVLGAKLFSVSKTNVLDLAGLRQGVYILKVFSEDRAISKKIIKD